MPDPLINQPLEKLPQNIRALIGEIGLKQVLLRLHLLAHGTPWNVFHNLGEAGPGLLLLNSQSGEMIRIEVKALSKPGATGKRPARIVFMLSDGEYQNCDFLVACLLDVNDFLIVPRAALRQAHAGGRIRRQMVVTLNASGQPHPRFEKYRNAWGSLLPASAAEAAPPDPAALEEAINWPELEEAIDGREAERRALLQELGAKDLLQDVEAQAEKLFQAKQVQEALAGRLDQVKALAAEWDPPVFALLKKLAEADRNNSTYQMRTVILASPKTGSHSLYWEALFTGWYYKGRYAIELALDEACRPKAFRVECKEPGLWLEAEPTLEALKPVLAQAYRLGKASDLKQEPKPGWVLREESRGQG